MPNIFKDLRTSSFTVHHSTEYKTLCLFAVLDAETMRISVTIVNPSNMTVQTMRDDIPYTLHRKLSERIVQAGFTEENANQVSEWLDREIFREV